MKQVQNTQKANSNKKVTTVINDTKGTTAPQENVKPEETIQEAQEVINNATKGEEPKVETPEVKEETVAPTATEKPKKDIITVTKAEYGTPGKMVDFTATCKVGQKLTNKMVTVDPHPGKVKSATVEITINDVPHIGKFTEGEKMLLTDFVKVETAPQENAPQA